MTNEEWIAYSVKQVERIAKEIRESNPYNDGLDRKDILLIAVEIHRNIILEQGLLPGYTDVPGCLESIAISLKEEIRPFDSH